MTKLPIVTRLSTSIEEREWHESRSRGAKLILAYLVLVGIVGLGLALWSVLSR